MFHSNVNIEILRQHFPFFQVAGIKSDKMHLDL
jgi:hypothetical protein